MAAERGEGGGRGLPDHQVRRPGDGDPPDREARGEVEVLGQASGWPAARGVQGRRGHDHPVTAQLTVPPDGRSCPQLVPVQGLLGSLCRRKETGVRMPNPAARREGRRPDGHPGGRAAQEVWFKTGVRVEDDDRRPTQERCGDGRKGRALAIGPRAQ